MVELDGEVSDAEGEEGFGYDGEDFGVGEEGVVGAGDVEVLGSGWEG